MKRLISVFILLFLTASSFANTAGFFCERVVGEVERQHGWDEFQSAVRGMTPALEATSKIVELSADFAVGEAIGGPILEHFVAPGLSALYRNTFQKGADIAAKGGQTFFEGAKYSDKVLRQMGKADGLFHGFLKSVDGFATKYGQWSTKIGGDGKAYQWLKMEGSYGGKTGIFEYTKDANGIINHRFFNVPK